MFEGLKTPTVLPWLNCWWWVLTWTLETCCGAKEDWKHEMTLAVLMGIPKAIIIFHSLFLFYRWVPLFQEGRGWTILLGTTSFLRLQWASSFCPLKFWYLAIGSLFMEIFFHFFLFRPWINCNWIPRFQRHLQKSLVSNLTNLVLNWLLNFEFFQNYP